MGETIKGTTIIMTGARARVEYTHTHTHTHTPGKYCNTKLPTHAEGVAPTNRKMDSRQGITFFFENIITPTIATAMYANMHEPTATCAVTFE